MKSIIQNEVKLTPIEEIKPNPRNAREHSSEQIAQIARSIEEFGFTSLIVVDEAGMILAGHGKWLAARQLNMTHVPTRMVGGLTETQKNLYLIADNQIGLNSSWDQELLHKAIEELEREAADLNRAGLSVQEIDRALADLAPEQGWTEEDEVPTSAGAVITRPGDVWRLDMN